MPTYFHISPWIHDVSSLAYIRNMEMRKSLVKRAKRFSDERGKKKKKKGRKKLPATLLFTKNYEQDPY